MGRLGLGVVETGSRVGVSKNHHVSNAGPAWPMFGAFGCSSPSYWCAKQQYKPNTGPVAKDPDHACL